MRQQLDDEAFGCLEHNRCRHNIDVQSTGQKSHCVSTLRGHRNALLQQTIGLPLPAPVRGTKFHGQVGRTDQSRDRTSLEPKRTTQPKRTTTVKLNKASFPADHPRPVLLAVASLDGGWGQWGPRQSIHARHQSDDEAFFCLERVTIAAAVRLCLAEPHHIDT